MSRRFCNIAVDVHVLSLVRDREVYTVIYRDEHAGEALRSLGRWARDENLAFTWYDAASLSRRIREEADRGANHGEHG